MLTKLKGYKKILITGNACAGKTTLAKQVHLNTKLPLYHLDQIVWQAGFKPTPLEQKRKGIDKLVQKDKWVIDGVSSLACENAEVIIFLDISRKILIPRAIKRCLFSFFRQRPELPHDCKDWKVVGTLLKIIWRFPRNVRPKLLNQPSSKIIFLTNNP